MASWRPPGNLLGSSWGFPESLSRQVGFLCDSGVQVEALRTYLGGCWVPLGAFFGTSGAVLGASEAVLGPSEAALGPSWVALGPSGARPSVFARVKLARQENTGAFDCLLGTASWSLSGGLLPVSRRILGAFLGPFGTSRGRPGDFGGL